MSEQNENDIASIKELAMKFSIENDTENTYLYMNKLISLGELEISMNSLITIFDWFIKKILSFIFDLSFHSCRCYFLV